jgi:pyruvate dehydrogenase E1 component beta subunit
MTTIIEALRDGLVTEMEREPEVFVMGEDIGIGGSFHLTLGLLDRFGPERIRDTPVAEAGFVGLGIGAALAGMRPVVDFQYGDFLLCAADQVIQQACKLRFMSGGQVHVPLVLHAPTGASGRGAQHANSVENFFCGVPGLTVGVPSTPYDAKGMMIAAIRHPEPVLICSHKHLYGTKGRNVEASALGDVPEEAYELEIGKAAVRREGRHITIVAALLMVHRALQAADQLAADGIEAEVIDLRWIRPLDMETIGGSVARTGRLVVAEEQWHEAGWGATIISRLAQSGASMAAPPLAVSLPDDLLIPYSPPLEDAFIPSAERIADAARSIVRA